MGRAKKGFTATSVALIVLALILAGGEFVPPPPECSDGIDNDGDGNIDNLDQAGCWFNPGPDPITMEPGTPQYCPNWTSELQPPTNQQQCQNG